MMMIMGFWYYLLLVIDDFMLSVMVLDGDGDPFARNGWGHWVDRSRHGVAAWGSC